MQKTQDLKHTLNLPRTPFSMKANLPENEPKWLARWAEEDLYGQIRAAREIAPLFTLHDGEFNVVGFRFYAWTNVHILQFGGNLDGILFGGRPMLFEGDLLAHLCRVGTGHHLPGGQSYGNE